MRNLRNIIVECMSVNGEWVKCLQYPGKVSLELCIT